MQVCRKEEQIQILSNALLLQSNAEGGKKTILEKTIKLSKYMTLITSDGRNLQVYQHEIWQKKYVE